MEKQVGEGRVLFWASSLDRDWSDMAIRPGFVPLMNQVILYLTGRLSHPRTWLHEAGDGHVILPPRGVCEIRVRDSNGKSFIARLEEGQWKGVGFSSEILENNKSFRLLFNHTFVTGLYEVAMRRPGGEFRNYSNGEFFDKNTTFRI